MKAGIEKILTVEDVFDIRDRGLVVAPKLAVSAYGGPVGKALLLLRRPGLEDARILAEFSTPMVSPPPKEPFVICMLHGLQKAEVPTGSEIWRFVEDEKRA